MNIKEVCFGLAVIVGVFAASFFGTQAGHFAHEMDDGKGEKHQMQFYRITDTVLQVRNGEQEYFVQNVNGRIVAIQSVYGPGNIIGHPIGNAAPAGESAPSTTP